MHNTKYIGLYIYHAFALKKNTNNNNNNNNQKKFVIMDMETTKGIKPIPKFKIPPLPTLPRQLFHQPSL
jgi:hypothetical protein